ncbi:hypothetical protein KAFR_0E02210 [Kazachstania africana CBS 2517]|uniref:6-phosphogluconolactonase-like protein n=1 Tax=Kazachstania africana (strain ATCC 22294 / BCRC 22015 / CBS 2517 / CECT 1963 / NBRC 1671 / NRRL Y-8276) TaxID=1071382 RepID=H2AVH4_KAZAF|nr:hypothetical protein KAFR_0E02210 [Kazachstania africana CBS 2517]CCF58374.1 hypothetical protein KAFR_0E02210 [Kazachstania africana CBS 2517]
MVTVNKFSSSDKLAHELGEYIISKQEIALEHSMFFQIAISGGSLTKVLQKCLIDDPELAPKVKWTQWKVFFVDERCVPLDDPDSNYGAFKSLVLDRLTNNGTRPSVHPINVKLLGQNEAIAKEYGELMPKEFHLLLLGCGPDGHTCSLFPGEKHRYLINETERRVMWCHDSPKPPSDRVTVTLPVLADADFITFVAEGASKQDIMQEIFDTKNIKLPCALINNKFDKKVTWFVNDEAFTKVKSTF